MVCHLFSADPIFLKAEHLLDQVLSLVRDIPPVVVDQGDCATFGQGLNFFDKLGVKRKLAREHEIEDDSQTEGIDFFIVILSLVDFRGDKARSACKFLLSRQFLQLILKDSEPKINQFDP